MNPHGIPECPRCNLFIPHTAEVCALEVSDRRARAVVVIGGALMMMAMLAATVSVLVR